MNYDVNEENIAHDPFTGQSKPLWVLRGVADYRLIGKTLVLTLQNGQVFEIDLTPILGGAGNVEDIKLESTEFIKDESAIKFTMSNGTSWKVPLDSLKLDVSAEDGNIIEFKNDGIYAKSLSLVSGSVTGTKLILKQSDDSTVEVDLVDAIKEGAKGDDVVNNIINTIINSGLADKLISSDADNMLTKGSDKKLYVNVTTIINKVINEIKNTTEIVKNVILSLVENNLLGGLISDNVPNILKKGTDNKFLVDPKDAISADDKNIIKLGSDKKLLATIADITKPTLPNPNQPYNGYRDLGDTVEVWGYQALGGSYTDNQMVEKTIKVKDIYPDGLPSFDSLMSLNVTFQASSNTQGTFTYFIVKVQDGNIVIKIHSHVVASAISPYIYFKVEFKK